MAGAQHNECGGLHPKRAWSFRMSRASLPPLARQTEPLRAALVRRAAGSHFTRLARWRNLGTRAAAVPCDAGRMATVRDDLAAKVYEAGRMTVADPRYEGLHGEIDRLCDELAMLERAT